MYFRNMKRILAICLVLGVVLLSCSKPQSFEYRDMRNFRLNNLGYDRSSISMDLVYFNPNNFGVDLKNVNCDIYINHNFMGKYLLDTTMFIAKKSEFVLPSTMEVDMRNMLKNSFNALFNKEVLLEAKGTTRVGKSGIFVTVPFTYSGTHKLGVFN
ncbi:MAG: type 2 family protein [Chitinophagaceae bacterium]|nr:type 2 family protein [Chitinophagaceae bacterium]